MGEDSLGAELAKRIEHRPTNGSFYQLYRCRGCSHVYAYSERCPECGAGEREEAHINEVVADD